MLGRSSSLSVRARVGLFAALMVVLLVVLGGTAAWNGERAAERMHLLATAVSPARSANTELTNSFRSADRALSIYVVMRRTNPAGSPADEQLLAPWREMASFVRSDVDTLDHLTHQPPFDQPEVAGDLNAQVAQLRASMLAWFEATAPLAEARPGQAPAPLPDEDEVERWAELATIALSDSARVQASLSAINVSIRQDIETQLRSATRMTSWMTLVAVLVAVSVAWGSSKGLLRPLRMLGDTVRRQVAGERQAWANTEVGACEIRSLAEDINRLNHEHLRLVDRQAQSITLLRAGNDAVARIMQADNLDQAAQAAADSLGETLGVDGVRLAGWSEREPFAAVYARTATAQFQVPELWWQRLAQEAGGRVPYRVVRVHDRGKVTDVDDLPGWIREDPVVAGATSAVFLPMRVKDTVVGIIGLNAWSDDREWDETEIAFMERVSRELTRVATGHYTNHPRL